MSKRIILALIQATYRLPLSALLSALLLASVAPITQAATVKTSNFNNGILDENPINPVAYCDNDLNREAKTQTTLSKYKKHQSSQRRTIDCMLTQLNTYQQNDKSAHQQYLAYKAQAWLNYAYNEDSINNITEDANQEALQTATSILRALKNGTDEQSSITTDIPTTSALMRPDLWATLNALKDNGGISAAPRELAFSEVALIWAATEQCKHGDKSSGVHFRMADRWLEQAREAYVNTHDSKLNVALEELINHYFKQYVPLDKGDDSCRAQTLSSSIQNSSSAQTLHTEIKRTVSMTQTNTVPKPIPHAKSHLVF
ncbi:hypothetical protein [Psychrobacter frigidicola]|uniref:hypothetical protein n=1 Tax=Psychrobacter frigidicola TaxID=45611 RepID=UPI0019194C1A|nr:hypothetical protein [Psychrobacter frigidicola]